MQLGFIAQWNQFLRFQSIIMLNTSMKLTRFELKKLNDLISIFALKNINVVYLVWPYNQNNLQISQKMHCSQQSYGKPQNIDISQKVQLARTNNTLKLLTKLKFQNQVYQPGTNIALNAERVYYGRILQIAQVQGIQFPVILISWYYSKEDLLEERISPKELFLSRQYQWQYIESISGKIQVHSNAQYLALNPSQRKNNVFFMSRLIDTETMQITSTQESNCFCAGANNPEYFQEFCMACRKSFHPNCMNKKKICGYCQ